jgi:N-acetylglucosamine malate deacetylase 1
MAPAQSPAVPAPRTVLVVGAHCGDAEITAGAILAKHRKLGDRAAILHMTLGEGGNPRMKPEAYGEQKRREALEAARVLGAETFFAPYKDGEIPNDEAARRYVADIIRQAKPTWILTHWAGSIHKDHTVTNAIVNDAVLLASLEGVVTNHPRWRGVRGIYYVENWEDQANFRPYMFVNVSEEMAEWEKAVSRYEFIRGGIPSFPYLDYYRALARVRGAESGWRFAVSMDVDASAKKRAIDRLP